MARIVTEAGVVSVRGTKSFLQVQTENAEKCKASPTLSASACGVPIAVPTPVVKPTTSLEKTNG